MTRYIRAAVLLVSGIVVFTTLGVIFIAGQKPAIVPTDAPEKFTCTENDGLQYCVSITSFRDKENALRIVMLNKVKNLRENPVTISLVGGFYNSYAIKIIDSNGNHVRTRREIDEEDSAKTGTVKTEISSTRDNDERTLSFGEEFTSEFSLADFYPLRSGDKYFVQITRKIVFPYTNRSLELSIPQLPISIP